MEQRASAEELLTHPFFNTALELKTLGPLIKAAKNEWDIHAAMEHSSIVPLLGAFVGNECASARDSLGVDHHNECRGPGNHDDRAFI